jgi:formate/nitrite transporter FocA (FNT family)
VGGVDVGAGVFALLLIETGTRSKLLGGLGLAIGFLALLLARSELFTENFLVPVVAVAARRSGMLQLGRLWFVAAVGNLVGGWIFVRIVVVAFPSFVPTAVATARYYGGLGFGWRSFALGVLGGLVITLMTWMQSGSTELGGKMISAVVGGWLLGAGRLNHAIVASLMVFAGLEAGHLPFGYVHWLQEFLFAAGANIVGGVGLVTCLRILQVPHRLKRERELAK